MTTGGVTAATVTVIECEMDPVLPESSVTVSITVNVAVAVGL